MGAQRSGILIAVGCMLCLPGVAGMPALPLLPAQVSIPWWQEHGLLGWLLAGVMLGIVIVRGAWGAQSCGHHHHAHAPSAETAEAAGEDCPCCAATETAHACCVEEADEVPAMTAEPVADDPQSSGALLARLQALHNDLDAMTQGVQRYSSQREVQLQQWQLLCQEIVRRLLPVLDNLSPYLADEDERVAEVAQLAYTRMVTELSTIGVTQIVPQVGEPFDGRYHQLSPESTGVPPYQVAQVCAVGFRLLPRVNGASETVLRPAEVIGASCTEPEPSSILDRDEDAQVYELDEALDFASIDLSAYAEHEAAPEVETEKA